MDYAHFILKLLHLCQLVHSIQFRADYQHNDWLNKSFITLIPKVDNPKNVNNLRPITLCNVVCKIITKIIVNRLRLLLSKIVGPWQANFMPGCQTKNNMIVTQKIIHSLERHKGKFGGIIWKIDLEKAYERIEWNFLEKVLFNFNFNENLIKLIMACVTKGSTSIIWNGETLNAFKPTRGLKQGDSLSPRIFVLCLEYLSTIINEKVNAKYWIGIKSSPREDAFSHLLFVNDLIFFAKATEKSCKVMMEVLNSFCENSGQRVHLSKSKIYCSPNVPRRDALMFNYIYGIAISGNFGTYLGFPLVNGKMKK